MVKKGKGAGLSFRSDAAIETGLFSSGPAVIKESIFALFDYGGNAKPVPVWLITFGRDGEEDYEQPYSLGKNWKISEDGTELIAKAGQTGLPKSCNAMRHLIKPLELALDAAGMDPDAYLTGDPTTLDGLHVVVTRVEQEKRNIKGKPGDKKRDDDKERTILQIEEVSEGKPAKGKAKAKAKPVADDDDDEDEDEAPAKTKGKKPAPADDDDDDDDEQPAAKTKAKAKGKAKPAADDDEDDSNELDEEAVEALVAALEAEDGPIKLADLEDAVNAALKGNPQRKALVTRILEDEFLELEGKGWAYDAKRQRVVSN